MATMIDAFGAATRMPPVALDAERYVLGAVLVEPAVLAEVRPILEPGDFFRADHERVYARVAARYDAGEPVNVVLVSDDMEREGMDGRDAWDLVTSLAESSPHTVDARPNAVLIKDRARTRRLIVTLADLTRDAYANDELADDLIAHAQQAVFALGDGGRDTQSTAAAAAGRVLDAIDRRDRGEVPGVTTGFHRLDALLDALQPRKLYVLAARPSIGKSALALNVAAHASVDGGVPTLFVSLEMTADELAERLVSARSGVNGHHFRLTHNLTRSDRERVHEAATVYAPRARLTFDDAAGLTVAQLCARAWRAKARDGIGLLVVDYLQLVDGPRLRGETREQEVSRISRALKALAKELEIPVLALCQLNRAVEGRGDHRPSMADLRESGQIEQDADAIMLLHRPDHYGPTTAPGLATVIVPKHRGGPTGSVDLWFTKELTRFDEIDRAAGENPFDGSII